jgi:hypothetical protein
MGFFGRIQNLGRGMWLNRGSSAPTPGEAALDAELDVMPSATAKVPASMTTTSTTIEPDPAERKTSGPERDENGNIIKTL